MYLVALGRYRFEQFANVWSSFASIQAAILAFLGEDALPSFRMQRWTMDAVWRGQQRVATKSCSGVVELSEFVH